MSGDMWESDHYSTLLWSFPSSRWRPWHQFCPPLRKETYVLYRSQRSLFPDSNAHRIETLSLICIEQKDSTFLQVHSFSLGVHSKYTLAHQRGICVHHYLDDWLVGVDSHLEQCLLLLQFYQDLETAINLEKSYHEPAQKAKYLVMLVDTIWERVYSSDSWITRFQDVAARFLSPSEHLAKLWQQFRRLMSSLKWFIKCGKLRMRQVQSWLKAPWSCLKDSLASHLSTSYGLVGTWLCAVLQFIHSFLWQL